MDEKKHKVGDRLILPLNGKASDPDRFINYKGYIWEVEDWSFAWGEAEYVCVSEYGLEIRRIGTDDRF